MEDSRLRSIETLLDDARTEITAIEDEGPPLRERRHLAAAHDAVNTAIRFVQNASGACVVCGGVGTVWHTAPDRVDWSVSWFGAQIVPCPACNPVRVV